MIVKNSLIFFAIVASFACVSCNASSQSELSSSVETEKLEMTESTALSETLNESTTLSETLSENTFTVYEALDEWKSMDKYDWGVQIDDIFIKYGMTYSQFVDAMNDSSLASDYACVGNPDKLVAGESVEKIDITRSGKVWFKVVFMNAKDNTVKLSNCRVCSISVNVDCFLHNTRFIDGKNYNEIMQMKYSDIQVLDMKSKNADNGNYSDERKESTYIGEKDTDQEYNLDFYKDNIAYTISSYKEDFRMGSYGKTWQEYRFVIDADTHLVVGYNEPFVREVFDSEGKIIKGTLLTYQWF